MARDDRLDVRLPSELKRQIEQAAAQLGQSTSNFVVGTLVKQARRVIRQQSITGLSNRDRDLFLALLDHPPAPNEALARAAERYKAQQKPDTA